ncbi:uroporphyrinogen-III synthase [Bradyrhizobium genosp. L]|uniref:uroporphyrinogen-III synthase n=1 Tax=Bradyrhizobium genosp. L TaxID=83637 RepID=UPI0018A3181E|nr:uroporphyrinogen-III synthase [Bradyrhizobium genosp. L]QPF85006.1 uroporphyrinogen-III synthase [Bradyrhizobium genosp. L]
MVVLVTRPHPDSEATCAALRARGIEALAAPVLRFEPLPFHDDDDADYDAVIVTSANALRGIDLAGHRLLRLPAFAVGTHTADAARAAGFDKVKVAKGDAEAVRDLVLARVKANKLKKSATLLYLAGADLARDLAGELGEAGLTVITHTTYRMVPVAVFPDEISDAFMASRVKAVLHYSRRSARAFLDAARAGGLEISALALPQCCISASVAAVLRDAGATQLVVAAQPDETALLEAVSRSLNPSSA